MVPGKTVFILMEPRPDALWQPVRARKTSALDQVTDENNPKVLQRIR
jgi:hypothetical protein